MTFVPPANRKIAEAEADRLWRSAGSPPPPVPAEELAHLAGLQVLRVKNPRGPLGELRPQPRLLIVNTRDERPTRERFTIAHELGHWTLRHHELELEEFLDPQFDEEDACDISRGPFYEVEANQFAAALLMPVTLLRAAVRAQGKQFDADALAREFGVSRQALFLRLMEKSLLPD